MISNVAIKKPMNVTNALVDNVPDDKVFSGENNYLKFFVDNSMPLTSKRKFPLFLKSYDERNHANHDSDSSEKSDTHFSLNDSSEDEPEIEWLTDEEFSDSVEIKEYFVKIINTNIKN